MLMPLEVKSSMSPVEGLSWSISLGGGAYMKQLKGVLLLGLIVFSPLCASEEIDIRSLVLSNLELSRGGTSYAEMTMFIKRPTWERRSSLVGWTRGTKDSLIRFTAPAKDAGNAMLKLGDKMWTFNPKLNRNIRLPSSMMGQSWAGSDFSYNDLSRSDKYLTDYRFELVGTKVQEGKKIYTIDAIPNDDAAVVWGKERMTLREDAVMMGIVFYDQDLQPLKEMKSLKIGNLGGRIFSTHMRMGDIDDPDSYTEFEYQKIAFDLDLEDRLFSTFSLRSERTR